MTDEANFGQYVIEHHDLSQYMRLDAAALKALTLMPSATDGKPNNFYIFVLSFFFDFLYFIFLFFVYLIMMKIKERLMMRVYVSWEQDYVRLWYFK